MAPRVFSIPPGVPFLPVLAKAFLDGGIIPGFGYDGDPLALADATIYVPTRRAARELRSVFVDCLGVRSAILPVIRPLGEFDEDAAIFGEGDRAALDLAPPVSALDRLLLLAPLVRAWKARLPAHVAALYEEDVVVPASTSDGIWLARDLADLMDEIETEEADWTKLAGLVPEDLAGWWQVTLEFLGIVTAQWPNVLRAHDRSNPAAHRNALLSAEAERLRREPPPGPVIAAGSTGSIPATARLLAAIAGLPQGAVVLPGLDVHLEEDAWSAIGDPAEPSAFAHPQAGLKKLLSVLQTTRFDVVMLGRAEPPLAARGIMLSEALRPAETTDSWGTATGAVADAAAAGALAQVSLVEAANEREEALSIAVALRHALGGGGRKVALVTPDRALARRVAVELRRFGLEADDSGGSPLSRSAPANLLRLALETVFRPGDPVALVALLKHPLLSLSMERSRARIAAETIELVALRGGAGRPDITSFGDLFEKRWAEAASAPRRPDWFARIGGDEVEAARAFLASLASAVAPLAELRGHPVVSLSEIVLASVPALEDLARGGDGSVATLYQGDAGEALAAFLRELAGSGADLDFEPDEWPDVLAALIATQTVKPAMGADPRVFIWGALEARLQSVDTLVLGGLNEGSWPQIPASDRFMSRLMKAGLDLEPPERRIGLSAHDFVMAMGAPEVVLTRSARAGDAPAVASRWLQRLLTCAGPKEAARLRVRGQQLVAWARMLDDKEPVDFAPRPCPAPPLTARPKRFSVTEIETLRRDPYAVYARRVLGLRPLDALLRDPGAAERGNLFHDILQDFIRETGNPAADDALDRLMAIGRRHFAAVELPDDVTAIWWPRFQRTAHAIVVWERGRAAGIAERHAEIRAGALAVAETGATLSGRADRIDIRSDGTADILDYKTGSSPSPRQAHTLLAPQLALEAALLSRGAFADLGARKPAELAYVRLKARGDVLEQTILKYRNRKSTAAALAENAWNRLAQLLELYNDPAKGYLSRVLPFREGDVDGDYDHLARVLEWSAGGDGDDDDEEGA